GASPGSDRCSTAALGSTAPPQRDFATDQGDRSTEQARAARAATPRSGRGATPDFVSWMLAARIRPPALLGKCQEPHLAEWTRSTRWGGCYARGRPGIGNCRSRQLRWTCQDLPVYRNRW